MPGCSYAIGYKLKTMTRKKNFKFLILTAIKLEYFMQNLEREAASYTMALVTKLCTRMGLTLTRDFPLSKISLP